MAVKERAVSLVGVLVPATADDDRTARMVLDLVSELARGHQDHALETTSLPYPEDLAHWVEKRSDNRRRRR